MAACAAAARAVAAAAAAAAAARAAATATRHPEEAESFEAVDLAVDAERGDCASPSRVPERRIAIRAASGFKASTAPSRRAFASPTRALQELGTAASARGRQYGWQQRGWVSEEQYTAVALATAQIDGEWCVVARRQTRREAEVLATRLHARAIGAGAATFGPGADHEAHALPETAVGRATRRTTSYCGRRAAAAGPSSIPQAQRPRSRSKYTG